MHYLPTYLPTYLCDVNYCSDSSERSDSSDSSDSSEKLEKLRNLSTHKEITTPLLFFSSSLEISFTTYLPTYLPTYLCDSIYCSDSSDSSE